MLGERAAELGLIDRFGDLDGVVRELGGRRRAPTWCVRAGAAGSARLPRMLAEEVVAAIEEAGLPRL